MKLAVTREVRSRPKNLFTYKITNTAFDFIDGTGTFCVGSEQLTVSCVSLNTAEYGPSPVEPLRCPAMEWRGGLHPALALTVHK